MLVRKNNIEYVKDRLSKADFVAIDTETSGLRSFHGDSPFAVVFAVDTEDFYVPVRVSNGTTQSDLIDISDWSSLFKNLIVFMHNAKFDLHHLATIGFHLPPEVKVHCTMVAARLCASDMPSYSLDACSKYFIREAKDDKVMAYLDANNDCWDWETKPGTSRRTKNYHFDRVPFDLIFPYAVQDTRLTYRLGLEQIRLIEHEDELAFLRNPKTPKLKQVLENEYRITRILEAMERKGIRLDRDKAQRAIAETEVEGEDAQVQYLRETGEDYKASSNTLYRHLEEFGADTANVRTTEYGNFQVDRKALGGIESPLAKLILCIKDAKTRCNFYHGFVYAADAEGFIHTDFKQSGAKTGRFSSSNPNLQNLKREDEDAPLDADSPRKMLTPPTPEHCFFMPDYSQMEYRLMLDYAGEMALIDAILAGRDIHQATADKVGIDRHAAKTLNFSLIYGAGRKHIAEVRKISLNEAQRMIDDYFAVLPNVKKFIDQVQSVAKQRKSTFNWYGRRNHYDGFDPKFHASVNHLIQGGCSDVLRVGLVGCHELLVGTKSWLSLTIHDENVFALHRDDLHLAPKLCEIMEKAYPYKFLPLTVSPSYSWKSLGDKVKGLPE